MKVLDLNILLYAVNRDSAHHEKARTWLEQVMTDDEAIGLPWVVLLGFLRLSASSRVFARPLSPGQALEVVQEWVGRPQVRALNAGEDHWRILKSLLAETGMAANLTTDAHLAALAIENGCELCSTDSDFGRFPRLKWVNPLRD